MRRIAAGLAGLALVLGACGAEGNPHDDGSEGGAPATGETLTVFAAASLQEAFDELLADFAADRPGLKVAPAVYDGSSTLVTQLVEGAEADVLATANESTMADAVDAGVMTGEPALFASNDLVIAVPASNPHGIADLHDLEGLDYSVCAEQVSCGDATVQLFDAAGLGLAPISEEQNVTSVANRISGGDVDAGFIYSTDVAARHPRDDRRTHRPTHR